MVHDLLNSELMGTHNRPSVFEESQSEYGLQRMLCSADSTGAVALLRKLVGCCLSGMREKPVRGGQGRAEARPGRGELDPVAEGLQKREQC